MKEREFNWIVVLSCWGLMGWLLWAATMLYGR
jgi:hypothetical protein